MPMFDRANLDLARRFMAGPGPRPDSPYAGRYPDMAGFSKTPAGQDSMARVLRNMQARRLQARPTTRPKQRRPAALEGSR